jgi:hypothetical protein
MKMLTEHCNFFLVAKDLISRLLTVNTQERINIHDALVSVLFFFFSRVYYVIT